MEYIYIGDIVNTHGLKGELRIVSDFTYKEKVFKKGFSLYIGRGKEKCIIETYRKHKNYDMVTFVGTHCIEDVIFYKGERVYIVKTDIEIEGYFHEDLIGLSVYSGSKMVGHITDIEKSKAHSILVIDHTKRVPYIDVFVEKIDIKEKRVRIHEIEGLFDEN